MDKFECTPAQLDFLKNAIAGFSPTKWMVELAGRAGSSRYFLRLSFEGKSYVMVVWDGRDEDWPRFLNIQKELASVANFLPEIYKEDIVRGLILEEDLGSITLKSFCNKNATDATKIKDAYQKVLQTLFQWQRLPLEVSPSISSRSMDVETFLWESWYYSHYCVADFCACEYLLNETWERERTALATEVASLPKVYIHRDFQSENVMLTEGGIRFVDYQGARLGPAGYDAASLLFDPYIETLDQTMTSELFDYFNLLYQNNFDRHSFNICAAQRLMQALGAYGNLSLHRGKDWYRQFIPIALQRLIAVLNLLPEYPAIREVALVCWESLA